MKNILLIILNSFSFSVAYSSESPEYVSRLKAVELAKAAVVNEKWKYEILGVSYRAEEQPYWSIAFVCKFKEENVWMPGCEKMVTVTDSEQSTVKVR